MNEPNCGTNIVEQKKIKPRINKIVSVQFVLLILNYK